MKVHKQIYQTIKNQGQQNSSITSSQYNFFRFTYVFATICMPEYRIGDHPRKKVTSIAARSSHFKFNLFFPTNPGEKFSKILHKNSFGDLTAP